MFKSAIATAYIKPFEIYAAVTVSYEMKRERRRYERMIAKSQKKLTETTLVPEFTKI
jgi:hypothetical protein